MFIAIAFSIGCLVGCVLGLMYAKSVKKALSDKVDG